MRSGKKDSIITSLRGRRAAQLFPFLTQPFVERQAVTGEARQEITSIQRNCLYEVVTMVWYLEIDKF